MCADNVVIVIHLVIVNGLYGGKRSGCEMETLRNGLYL